MIDADDDRTPPEMIPDRFEVKRGENKPLVFVLADLALEINGLCREVAKLNEPASEAIVGRIADGLGHAGEQIRAGMKR